MTQLCHISDLDDQSSIGFASEHGPVFVIMHDGQPFVYLNECPHLGVNLEFNENEFLDSEGSLIECSTHGALFLKDTGECITGPCQGDYLTAIPFDVIDGMITLKG